MNAATLLDEILSLELLADIEDDFDNAPKAKRLRTKARKLRRDVITKHAGAAGAIPADDVSRRREMQGGGARLDVHRPNHLEEAGANPAPAPPNLAAMGGTR